MTCAIKSHSKASLLTELKISIHFRNFYQVFSVLAYLQLNFEKSTNFNTVVSGPYREKLDGSAANQCARFLRIRKQKERKINLVFISNTTLALQSRYFNFACFKAKSTMTPFHVVWGMLSKFFYFYAIQLGCQQQLFKSSLKIITMIITMITMIMMTSIVWYIF